VLLLAPLPPVVCEGFLEEVDEDIEVLTTPWVEIFMGVGFGIFIFTLFTGRKVFRFFFVF
jgi:hypothetical protein